MSPSELSLENELQKLRLELREKDARITHLEGDLTRMRLSAQDTTNEVVHLTVEKLLSNAAAPVAQLLAQAHLLETRGKPVAAQDILQVARRLIQVIQSAGLELIGEAGLTVQYDPALHIPLRAGVELVTGQTVIIRFAGARYQGKVLRPASVETGEV